MPPSLTEPGKAFNRLTRPSPCGLTCGGFANCSEPPQPGHHLMRTFGRAVVDAFSGFRMAAAVWSLAERDYRITLRLFWVGVNPFLCAG